MKRKILLKHLEENNCFLYREGGKHSVYKNVVNGKISTVQRHPDINDYLANEICKQLEIPKVR